MGNFIDLTGQQFGEITVLKLDEERSVATKRKYWWCKCSCGREKSIRADGLKKIKTCGECKKDLTGKKFGRLTVVKKGKIDKNGHQYYICQCDCGKMVEINSDNLRRGLTKSCGCLQAEITHNRTFKDLTGQKFGLLTCLNYTIINNKTYWNCRCDCGNFTTVAASNLTNGHTKSCGCINYSIGEKHIEEILKQEGVSYYKEYSFSKLPNRRYDFYLPDYNRLVEFDGKQHYNFVNTWHQTKEEHNKALLRDKEKTAFALSNNIELVRIPYWERENITLDMILGMQYLIKESADAPDMEEAQEELNEKN